MMTAFGPVFGKLTFLPRSCRLIEIIANDRLGQKGERPAYTPSRVAVTPIVVVN